MEQFEEQSINELTEKFKQMLSDGESKYFDSEEMGLIIEEFIYSYEFEYCNKAIDYAISLFPSNPFFRILKAKKLRMEFEFEAAEKELSQIERDFPPSAEFYKEKFSLLTILKDSNEETYQLLHKAYQLAPADPEIHFLLAFEFLKKKKLPKAINCVVFAIENEESFGEQLYNFSYLFEDNKQYEDALVFYKALTEKFPLLKGTWFGLGLALSWLEDHAGAIDAYRFSLSIDEDTPTAHFNIANSYFEMKEYEKALEHYESALHLDDQDFNSISSIGDCYVNLHRFEEALACYHHALSINPHHHDAIMGIVSILQTTGRIKESQVFLEKAFSLNPQSFDALFTIVNCYEDDDQDEKLLEFFDLTLRQLEDKAEHFRSFVLYCCQNELYDAGIEVIYKYRLDPEIENFSAYYLAAFHYLSGDIPKGNQYLCDALMVNYEEYPSFLSLDPVLESFSEILNLIAIFKP